MSFFTTMKVSGAALAAERLRVDLVSANLANANSTQSVDGGPYQRRDPIFVAEPIGHSFGSALDRAVRTVVVRRVVTDPRPPREVFNPSHPDADEEGIVRLPNIDVGEEMVNMMSAQRAYEANLATIRASREMVQRALQIGKST